MDRITEYRHIVKELLKRYASQRPEEKNVETQLIFDPVNDHYQLLNVGWEDEHRVYYCVLHLDLKGDKVWIQQNNTEHRVAEELIEMGIPKNRIVLGFQSPYKRQFTEFAVA
ncbi:MAG: XisI protein [Anaerolineales bacterium]|nr:XisI protein [Anaerolineales bacterium]